MQVHIIGGGNLGVAIALGLADFSNANHQITVTRRNTESIQYLNQKNIQVQNNNLEGIATANVVILTIKPFQVEHVIAEIKPYLTGQILASAASGATLEKLKALLPPNYPVMRIMPNIAAQFGESATCAAFDPTEKDAAQTVMELFEPIGTVSVIDEKLMDAATVLGASGTAFALRYIRASMQAGIEIGFDSKTALAIAAQTVKGAATMLLTEKVHPEQLIDKVTTPKGCTIVGLNEMELGGFSASLIKGIKMSVESIQKK